MTFSTLAGTCRRRTTDPWIYRNWQDLYRFQKIYLGRWWIPTSCLDAQRIEIALRSRFTTTGE